jgi:hypothetical protein
MIETPTSFVIALPGPSLESPLLFERHAQRIEAWLRQRYPPASGYRVQNRSKRDKPDEGWTIAVSRGVLSGAVVELKPESEARHKAMLRVKWESPLSRFLTMVGFVSAIPFALVGFGLGVFLLRFFCFGIIAAMIVAFIWMMFTTMIAIGTARLAAAAFGNEFDDEHRAEMARYLKTLPLAASLDAGSAARA